MEPALHNILDSVHDGMIAVDAKACVTIFNKAAKDIMKIKDHDLLGRHIKSILPNSRLPWVLKEGKSELNQKFEIGDIMVITNRMPVMDGKGEIIGAVAIFKDITEVRKLAEEVTKLKEISSMLEAIFNSTQDAISAVDEDGICVMVNPAYAQISGTRAEDIIGKPTSVDIVEGESIHLQVLKTKQPIVSSMLKIGPRGRDIIVDAAPILVDNKLKGSVAVIHDVSEIKRLTKELRQAKQVIRELSAKYSFDDILGEDVQMLLAIEKAKRAATTLATVLLRGESGTGKELFAHAIHNDSVRKYKPLVSVNCAAISESLLDSELFGYEEGAFTGAKKGGHKGLFEAADGGTIFLDEIGKMSLNIQNKLLRVLQEKEIMRVGGNKTISIDARVIAATNSDLEKAVREGTFREDLYYRINVIPIHIPPLRHRKKDIPLLVDRLIKKYNREYGRYVKVVAKDVLKLIGKMEWRGNVRELENFIGRIMLSLDYSEEIIEKKHLPEELLIKGNQKMEAEIFEKVSIELLPLDEVIEEIEKKYIKMVLEKNNFNKTRAAEKLDISIRSLYYKIEKYNIQREYD